MYPIFLITSYTSIHGGIHSSPDLHGELPLASGRAEIGVGWTERVSWKPNSPRLGDQIILGSDSNCKVNKGCICKVRFKFGVETWAGKSDCICVLGLATDLG